MSELTIHVSTHFSVSQASFCRLPGYLIVESRADITRLDELSEEALHDLAHCLAESERVVRDLLEPERVYTLRFGESLPRIHFHVIPRTARVAELYSSQVADQPPFSGASLVAWLWRNEASLQIQDDELQGFLQRAKARFRR